MVMIAMIWGWIEGEIGHYWHKVTGDVYYGLWLHRPAQRLKSAAFNLWVASNMFLCAVLFSFWAKPRETLSGFIGRRALMGSTIALYAARAIDRLYSNETAHCGETALAEDEARFVLYPDTQIATENLQDFHPENNPQDK
jgi:hypothetical protein